MCPSSAGLRGICAIAYARLVLPHSLLTGAALNGPAALSPEELAQANLAAARAKQFLLWFAGARPRGAERVGGVGRVARRPGSRDSAGKLSARPTRTLVSSRIGMPYKTTAVRACTTCGTCPHICDQRKVRPLESSSLQRRARIPGDFALWRHSAARCSTSQRLPSFHLMPSQASPSAALGCHLPTCTPSPASTCGTQR